MEEHQGNDKEGSLAQKNPKKRKQTVTQTQRPHYDPNNQEASHSPNSVLKALERHNRSRTAEQDASVNVGEQPKDSCEQHLDDETKKEKEKQRVTQTQRPHCDPNNQGASHSRKSVQKALERLNRSRTAEKDTSVNVVEQPKDTCKQHLDDETKKEKEEQRVCQKPDIGPEELKGEKEPKRNSDVEETTQMRQDRKEERLQARGEEGDEENVETDTSIDNHTTVSEVKSSGSEEAQDNEDSNTGEKSKSETRVEDTSVNFGEQPKDSCEQHLDEKTKTEKQKQRVTPPQRRHHGLYNQGSSCYLNSVLQVLFVTTEIHDRLNQQTDRELRQIFTDLKRKTCGTENITRSLKIENVYEQRDAAECLQKILDHISPKASEVFRGQLRDTTKCFKGHIINVETNPFWTLPLSLKDTPDTTYSVESSFERTFQTKTYYSDNMVHCNDCKQKTKAKSRCEMVEAPQILILLLKRFDFDYNTRSHFRSDCCVEVPCELQLKNKTYKLYGMVNHMGSLRGGHYTATVLSEDNTWYECNDSHVSKVKHQLFADDRIFSSRMVYILMYRATESEMSCELRQNEEDEAQTSNDNKLFDHQTGGEEDNTEGNFKNKTEGLKKTDKVLGRLKNFFSPKKWFSPSKATECQKPVETNSEDSTDAVKEEQGEDIGPAEPKKPKNPKRNSQIKTDDEKNTQMGHSAEDEGQMRQDRKEERLQARGEEGDAENVETDTSINNHTTVSEVKSSEDEEAQGNEDSNTQRNRKSKQLNVTLL